jgi:hypothetical protein
MLHGSRGRVRTVAWFVGDGKGRVTVGFPHVMFKLIEDPAAAAAAVCFILKWGA